MNPLVSVVILNWNGMKHLDACLTSISEQTFGDHEVLLVDNASTDGSADHVAGNYPSVSLIRNSRNLGFGKGMNIGIHESRGKYLFLLNNDTVLDRGCLAALVEKAEVNPSVAIISPKLLFYHNPLLVNSAGVEMNLAGYCWDRGFARFDAPGWNRETEILGCTGGAMFVRSAILKETGYFEPGFEFYFEDMDLCLRVRSHGYSIIYAPEAVVYHKYSASMDTMRAWYKEYFLQRNRLRLIWRNLPVLKFSFRYPKFWIHLFGSIILAFVYYREYRLGLIKLKALAANLLYLPRLIAYKIRESRRMDAQTWAFITKRIEMPRTTRLFEVDYEIATEKSEGLPGRLIMGINDSRLGYGWCPLERDRPVKERPLWDVYYRWFGKKATVFLCAPESGPFILQIHALFPKSLTELRKSGPPGLTAYINGSPAGTCLIDQEWKTCRIPAFIRKGVVRVDLEADRMLTHEDGLRELRDVGLALNEISLLPEDSIFLRETV